MNRGGMETLTGTNPSPFFKRLEPLLKIIECALLSHIIKHEKPISLLIAAKPESGKTTAMKLYKDVKTVLYLTDATAYGISENYLQQLASKEKRTIIIPDLLTPLSKSTKTRNNFIAFMNNLLEEGVSKVATYAYTRLDGKDVTANLITGVTASKLVDRRRKWSEMGFLSRCLIFTYSYSEESVDSILERYSLHPYEGGDKPEKVKLTVPKRKVEVELSKELGDRLSPIAKEIGRRYEAYGIRAKINLRCLLKCLAYRNDRREVSEADFEELLELVEFMNFDFTEV